MFPTLSFLSFPIVKMKASLYNKAFIKNSQRHGQNTLLQGQRVYLNKLNRYRYYIKAAPSMISTYRNICRIFYIPARLFSVFLNSWCSDVHNVVRQVGAVDVSKTLHPLSLSLSPLIARSLHHSWSQASQNTVSPPSPGPRCAPVARGRHLPPGSSATVTSGGGARALGSCLAGTVYRIKPLQD